jgi:hypothetical protein
LYRSTPCSATTGSANQQMTPVVPSPLYSVGVQPVTSGAAPQTTPSYIVGARPVSSSYYGVADATRQTLPVYTVDVQSVTSLADSQSMPPCSLAAPSVRLSYTVTARPITSSHSVTPRPTLPSYTVATGLLTSSYNTTAQPITSCSISARQTMPVSSYSVVAQPIMQPYTVPGWLATSSTSIVTHSCTSSAHSTPSPRPATRNIATQIKPSTRSKGVQVRRSMKDAGTECRLLTESTNIAALVPACTLTSIYVKKRKLVPSDTDSPSTILNNTDSTYHIEDDCSLPNTGSSTIAFQPQQQQSVHSETKYIVFQSCLWKLFEACPTC